MLPWFACHSVVRSWSLKHSFHKLRRIVPSRLYDLVVEDTDLLVWVSIPLLYNILETFNILLVDDRRHLFLAQVIMM